MMTDFKETTASRFSILGALYQILLLILIGIIIPLPSLSAGNLPILLKYDGPMEITAEKETFKKPLDGMKIPEGAKITTGIKGSAVIMWPQGHIVVMFESSEVVLEKPFTDANLTIPVLSEASGKIFARISGHDELTSFIIKTGPAVIRAGESEIHLARIDKNEIGISLLRGAARAETGGSETPIPEKHSLRILKGEPPETDSISPETLRESSAATNAINTILNTIDPDKIKMGIYAVIRNVMEEAIEDDIPGIDEAGLSDSIISGPDLPPEPPSSP